MAPVKSLRERLVEEERRRQEELDAILAREMRAERESKPLPPTTTETKPQQPPKAALSLKERLLQEEKRRQEELAAIQAREQAVTKAPAKTAMQPKEAPKPSTTAAATAETRAVSLSMRERILQEHRRRQEGLAAGTTTNEPTAPTTTSPPPSSPTAPAAPSSPQPKPSPSATVQPKKALSMKERLLQEEKRRQEELAAIKAREDALIKKKKKEEEQVITKDSPSRVTKAISPQQSEPQQQPQKALSMKERLIQEQKRRQEELAAMKERQAPATKAGDQAPKDAKGMKERVTKEEERGAQKESDLPKARPVATEEVVKPPSVDQTPAVAAPAKSLKERLLEEQQRREAEIARMKATDKVTDQPPDSPPSQATKRPSLKERLLEMERQRERELEELEDQARVAKIRSHVRSHLSSGERVQSCCSHVVNDDGMAESAFEALAHLKEGNKHFLSREAEDKALEVHQNKRRRAVVLICADWRVPPELLFEQGAGDICVVRTINYTVDTPVKSALLCGIQRLGAALVVVMGHEGCGIDGSTNETNQDHVMPHVKRAVDALQADQDVNKLMVDRGVRVVGCYSTKEGGVNFSDDALQAEFAALALRKAEQEVEDGEAGRRKRLNREMEAARTARIKARLNKLKAEKEVARAAMEAAKAAELEAFWAAEEAECECRGATPSKRVRFMEEPIFIVQAWERAESGRELAEAGATVGPPVEEGAEAGAAEGDNKPLGVVDGGYITKAAAAGTWYKKLVMMSYDASKQKEVLMEHLRAYMDRCVTMVSELRLCVQPHVNKLVEKDEVWLVVFFVLATSFLLLLISSKLLSSKAFDGSVVLPVDPILPTKAPGLAKRMGQAVASRVRDLGSRTEQMVVLALDSSLI